MPRFGSLININPYGSDEAKDKRWGKRKSNDRIGGHQSSLQEQGKFYSVTKLK